MADAVQCPECQSVMDAQTVGAIVIEICGECGAAWFGRGQLRRLLDQGPAVLDQLISFEPAEPHARPAPSRILCPDCKIPLHQGPLQGAQTISIQTCYGCAAIFIESEELTKLDALAQQPGSALTPLFSAPVRDAIENITDAAWRSDYATRRAASLYNSLQMQVGLNSILGGPGRF